MSGAYLVHQRGEWPRDSAAINHRQLYNKQALWTVLLKCSRMSILRRRMQQASRLTHGEGGREGHRKYLNVPQLGKPTPWNGNEGPYTCITALGIYCCTFSKHIIYLRSPTPYSWIHLQNLTHFKLSFALCRLITLFSQILTVWYSHSCENCHCATWRDVK